MKRNYSIEKSIEFIKDGRNIDLHNCYNFKGLVLPGSKAVVLEFEPHEVHGEGMPAVNITFTDVNHFELSKDYWKKDLEGIDEVGWKNPNDNDLDWIMEDYESSSEDHMIFRFSEGAYLRVHAGDSSMAILNAEE